MPKRPRNHIIEDLATGHLLELLSAVGWTVEEISKDYGEDFLVRIFDDGEATPWTFFIQSKATDNLEKYLSQDKRVVLYPIKTEHLKYWKKFWEPVILIVFDTSKRISYWEIIQDILDKIDIDNLDSQKIKVTIPIDNILNQEGVERIRAKTIRRSKRFENQKEGAKILIEELKKQWDVDIEYSPQSGFLKLPKGRFVSDPSGGLNFIFFGRFAERIEWLQRSLGISDPKLVADNAIDMLSQVVDEYSKGSHLVVKDCTGKVVEKYETMDELFHMLKRQDEINE